MQEVVEEVSAYLERTRGQYGRFLAAIQGELGDLKDRARNHELVYRIYSRGDKQVGGDILKSDTGIAKKLKRWRDDDNFHYHPSEVHDIIGITIVTYFDSGVDRVVSILERVDAFRSFKYLKTEKINRGGYAASHVIVHGRGVSRSRFRCEIQVKALLNDSWATKTHDLTYKVRHAVDPRIKALIEEIGNQLQGVERQSEELRDIVLSHEEEEKERRNVAVVRLFTTASEQIYNSDDSSIAECAKILLEKLDHFSECHQEDIELNIFVDKLAALTKVAGQSRSTCSLAMLLATSRRDRDIDEIALEAINNWVNTAKGDERVKAVGFEAQACWSLGELDRAVKAAEQLVSLYTTPADKAFARLDLAYYKAEQIFSSGAPSSPAAIEKVRNLLKNIPKASCERTQMSMNDTKGAVLIMTATSVHDVTKGIKLCEKAWNWAQQTPDDIELFRGFFSLHRERGNRQLKALATS